ELFTYWSSDVCSSDLPAGCPGPGGSAAPAGHASPPAAFPAAGDGMAPGWRCPGRVGSFAVRPPPGRLAGRVRSALRNAAARAGDAHRRVARILASHWLAKRLATGRHGQAMPGAAEDCWESSGLADGPRLWRPAATGAAIGGGTWALG